MRQTDVVLIVGSDLHLSANPPIARSTEPSWNKATRRVLRQLEKLKEKYRCELAIAGDLFDRWSTTPELLSLAIKNISRWHAVPGNHDLPWHSMDEIKRSAFWTLVEAGKVVPIDPGVPMELGSVRLHGFPCGVPVQPFKERHSLAIEVAVVHELIWKKGFGFEGAPDANLASRFEDRLKGYDLAFFGDNHAHFTARVGDCLVWNCGCLSRRKTTERRLSPSVALVKADGTVERCELDCSKDEWNEEDDVVLLESATPDLTDFVDGLRKMNDAPIDFREAVARALDDSKVGPGVRKLVLEATGG